MFNLCPGCLEKYRALRFDPNARSSPCLIPFDCIVWSDEHTPPQTTIYIGHEACLHTLIRLVSVRKTLWRTGQIPEELQKFWREAQETIPDWPGFKRLVLTQEDVRALDFCEEETADMMSNLKSESSIFAISDKGDGVMSFTAHLSAPRPTDHIEPIKRGDPPLPNDPHFLN